MNFKETLTNSFESIFIAAILLWTVAVTTALLQPTLTAAPAGTVEIYSLTSIGPGRAI